MVDVQKYRKVKQILQKVVEENRKIQEIVDKQEILTSILISEKEFLLKRLMKFDDDLLISSDTDREDEPVAVVKSLKTKATKKSSNPSSIVQTTPSIVKASASTAISETPLQTPSKQPGEEGSKKKRALSSAKKVKKVVDYDRDESGAVLLPQVFGMTELVALGQVSLKPGYHTTNYIYPIGFTTKRQYPSYTKLEPVEYTCMIIDGGIIVVLSLGDSPKFQITADDDPDNPIVASSASGAWTMIMKGFRFPNVRFPFRLNIACCKLRSKEFSSSVSGPEYFGFSQPTIQSLIQKMENVDKLTGYVMQEFEIGGKKSKKKKIKKDE